MTSKKLLIAALAVVLGAVFSYHFAQEERGVSKVVSAVAPSPVPGKNSMVNRVEMPAAMTVPVSVAPDSTGDIRVPIDTRRGHSMASRDLTLAMMRHPELELTKEEMEQLLTAYLVVVEKRANFEASIARVQIVSPLERNLIIPPYPQEGLAMQAAMYRIFSAVLGSERGARVEEALQSELYIRNYGFGESEQTIHVKLSGVAMPGTHYEITHGVATIHTKIRDDAGNMRDMNLAVKNARSLLPLSDLSAYSAFVELFPVGGSGT